MKYLVTGKEMKFLDQNTSKHFHVPELVLMEQAAMSFVQKLLALKLKFNKVLVVAGAGNNGADGIAISRLLNQRNITSSVLFVEDLLSEKVNTSKSYQVQKEIYKSYDMDVENDISNIDNYDLVIDAIFGIGLSHNISGEYQNIIEDINKSSAIKLAVDIPSGISADDGSLLGSAISVDFTITFSFFKLGQFLWPATDYCGEVILAEIGITKESFLDKKPKAAFYELTDFDLLPKRSEHSNKGTFGKLLIIAGNKDMAGAACFSAKAAYKSGAGLVKVYTAEENRTVLHQLVPEAILSTYNKTIDKKILLEELKWADAVVLGPGIGTDDNAQKIVDIVLTNVTVPMVVDADALNIIATNVERLLRPHMDIIITPHLGEMSRLTGDAVTFIQSNLTEVAMDMALKYDLICVLKDFHTVTSIPYGINYLNLTGNYGMATAGSGDVLTGIIGALLAWGVSPELASSFGVYVHGLAGNMAADKISKTSITASDIIEALNIVWKQ